MASYAVEENEIPRATPYATSSHRSLSSNRSKRRSYSHLKRVSEYDEKSVEKEVTSPTFANAENYERDVSNAFDLKSKSHVI